MRRPSRRVIVWCLPLPLLALPAVALMLLERSSLLASPWASWLKPVLLVLIAPGLMCMFALRSAAAMVIGAGVCWYLVGVGCVAAVVTRRGERTAARIAFYTGLAWLLAIFALGMMWANADLD